MWSRRRWIRSGRIDILVNNAGEEHFGAIGRAGVRRAAIDMALIMLEEAISPAS
ncbi:hypothetical protein [Novosphingobium sp.]|uniref:hypothetical protein n=1 Tax=Novosphingobium sp. TaxID=1874826 RepID=UPI002B4701E0|nr:hypothetical protein [Novosphingobium sp.]HKR91318.1 hypothetical protein [Novosphingobium sp.]